MNKVLYLNQRVFGPTDLVSGLSAVFGGQLSALWIGEDLTFSGNAVTGWPARVGTSASITGSRTKTYINGRVASTNTSAANSNFAATVSGSSVAAWVVAGTPAAPFVNYWTMVVCPAGSIILANSGASSWYPPGPTHQDGGSTSAVVPSGTHIWESGAYSVGNWNFGGDTVNDRPWPEAIGSVMLVSGTVTSGQRASAVSLLRSYYGI